MWNHGPSMAEAMQAQGRGSPAAVIAALWSHGDFMADPAAERSLSWPN